MSSDYPLLFDQVALRATERLVYTVPSGTTRLDGLFLRATNTDPAVSHSVTVYGISSTPLVSGAHSGADGSTDLEDVSQAFEVNEFVGRSLVNTTDGSSGEITANTATTITAVLAGGTENDWDMSDNYQVLSGFSNESLITAGALVIPPADSVIITVHSLGAGVQIRALADVAGVVNLSPVGGRVFT